MFYVIMYVAAIVAANLLVVKFGAAIAVVNAFLFIGLDLTARDHLHDAWRQRGLWGKMTLLIGSGSALSWLLNRNAGPIALASFVAFACAGIVDAVVYHLLGDRSKLLRINGSNVVSAAVDSVAFPLLAFGWPPMLGVMAGQFVAKVFGGALWSLVLDPRAWRKFVLTDQA